MANDGSNVELLRTPSGQLPARGPSQALARTLSNAALGGAPGGGALAFQRQGTSDRMARREEVEWNRRMRLGGFLCLLVVLGLAVIFIYLLCLVSWLYATWKIMFAGDVSGPCGHVTVFMIASFCYICGGQGRDSPMEVLLVIMFRSAFGVILVFWGSWALEQSRPTCVKAHPEAFSAVETFLYYFRIYIIWCVISGIAALVVVRYAEDLAEIFGIPLGEGGCEEAVREKFERVPFDRQALTNPVDGLVEECPICMSNFDAEEAIVRTPCGHNFHLECLATWCKDHNRCPLCRECMDSATGEPAEP